MPMFYVATLARYVVVEAETEDDAREAGRRAHYDLYGNLTKKFSDDVPINIRTVCSATAEEIELWRWHHEMVRGERDRRTNDQQRV